MVTQLIRKPEAPAKLVGDRIASAKPRSAESFRREAEALHQAAMLAEFNGTYELAREYRDKAARALQAAHDAETRKS